MKGLDKFIKETATENKKAKEKKASGALADPRWERDIENIHTLLHIATYQAVDNMRMKKA
jgi:hypothetical protein